MSPWVPYHRRLKPTTPPTLTLVSAGLLSKWGFGDGDEPDEFVDWWDDHEPWVDYPTLDWHSVLRILVRRHLVPAIEQHHTIEVYDMETAHNPIRARTVDGRECDYPRDNTIMLRPELIEVSYDDVMAAVREVVTPDGSSVGATDPRTEER